MKARYNCAHKVPPLKSPLDYKLYLHAATEEKCDIKHMVDSAGGILQLAKKIRTWSHRRPNAHYSNVLISGTSFLRQVFEALTCRFRDHIQDGFLKLGGAGMSEAAWANHSYGVRHMGDIVSMESQRAGCHGDDYDLNYEEGVGTPPNPNRNCTDNFSMVEFPGKLRVYYIFRLSTFDDHLEEVLAKINLDLNELDIIVTNDLPHLRKKLLDLAGPAIPVMYFARVFSRLQALMVRDSGELFGADNVGIRVLPDVHPCMPGIPDDEVNILLFALAHKLLTFN